jgi:hypothetical protein
MTTPPGAPGEKPETKSAQGGNPSPSRATSAQWALGTKKNRREKNQRKPHTLRDPYRQPASPYVRGLWNEAEMRLRRRPHLIVRICSNRDFLLLGVSAAAAAAAAAAA